MYGRNLPDQRDWRNEEYTNSSQYQNHVHSQSWHSDGFKYISKNSDSWFVCCFMWGSCTIYIVDLVVMLHLYLDHVEGLKSLRTRLWWRRPGGPLPPSPSPPGRRSPCRQPGFGIDQKESHWRQTLSHKFLTLVELTSTDAIRGWAGFTKTVGFLSIFSIWSPCW